MSYQDTACAILCGLHNRLGESSPVGLLDQATVRDLVILSLLPEMLDDYKGIPEIEPPSRMEEMIKTYTGPLQQFNRDRLIAYYTGQKADFRDKICAQHHCYDCNAFWYDASYPGTRSICPKCGQNSRVMTWNCGCPSVPPWVNIETFAIYWGGASKRLSDPPRRSQYEDFDEYNDYEADLVASGVYEAEEGGYLTDDN